MNKGIEAVGWAHGQVVHGRRIEKLVAAIAPLLERDWSVCDIGCGDGNVGHLIQQSVPGLTIRGFEYLPREDTRISVEAFDGKRLPLEDKSVDAAILVDVLHHTHDPKVLLAEAQRISRHAVILKEHRTSRFLAGATLRFMDWVGNRSHGVPLPYNYWSEERWSEAFRELGLEIASYRTRLDLYPWPARWLFESGLQFVARLTPKASGSK